MGASPSVQDLFSKFGELRDVYRPNDYYTQAPKRFAFVEYLDSAHATKAREELDGTTQFGEPMSIQEAKHGRKNRDDMRARYDLDTKRHILALMSYLYRMFCVLLVILFRYQWW